MRTDAIRQSLLIGLVASVTFVAGCTRNILAHVHPLLQEFHGHAVVVFLAREVRAIEIDRGQSIGAGVTTPRMIHVNAIADGTMLDSSNNVPEIQRYCETDEWAEHSNCLSGVSLESEMLRSNAFPVL